MGVDHVVDVYRRYPGEPVEFYTRVTLGAPSTGYTLRVQVPEGLTLEDYAGPPVYGDTQPYVEVDEAGQYVLWELDASLPAGTRHEYRTLAIVAPVEARETLCSEARVAVRAEGEAAPLRARESVCVAVQAKAAYVEHLPSIYEQDDLMNRFLMLFESFWRPIEQQIDQISYYVDAKFTPVSLLPWLASWVNLTLDERWPEARRRKLLLSAVRLYRKRGTRAGLRESLEIYTGSTPEIVEHRAHNLRLGPEARLGPGIALGTGNVPHTFSVKLTLPPVTGEDAEVVRRQEHERRRKIATIIDAEKPAHAAYTLEIETRPESAEAG